MATILLLEDNVDIRETLIDIIQGAGYDVLGASNGREGLERLLTTPVPPDLILLDLVMPEMDGHAFRALLRERPEWQSIPVVICSATVNQRQADELSPLAGLLRKPVEVTQLLAILSTHCPVEAVPSEESASLPDSRSDGDSSSVTPKSENASVS